MGGRYIPASEPNYGPVQIARNIRQLKRSVYMDANATTALLPEVYDAMIPYLLGECGNASSGHRHGRQARAALETARQQVAYLLNASDAEIVFTSGGTEADNLAILGAVTEPDAHIITSSIEHYAVFHAVKKLEQKGCAATYLPVGANGQVNPDDVLSALRPNTRLISIMLANNETGVLQPIAEIGRIAREHSVLFHTDAVQAAGKIPIDVERIGCDLVSISSHKMHGPQGTGALFVRRGVKLEPISHGGTQELRRRAGTENIVGVVGFGEAAVLARNGLKDGSLKKLAKLRDALERSVLLEVEEAGVNGSGNERVPNTTNIWFGGIDGPALLAMLDRMGVSVSGGSACNAGACEPSHVLIAMGLTPGEASRSVRFSLSKQTTAEDVDFAMWQVAEAVGRLREKGATSRVTRNSQRHPKRCAGPERI
jgi:cysteine desulfurase